ncbi:hypothetical protein, conserved [Eimeria tenella]|uniref:Iron donor protein CyaY protein n=1 Tax=Eimeria tenella TaxID=5802 RepID=U6KQN7_EIMTE|nr:hypothetical protein, conserved [Eimeria tenella]CDJ40286.1 hypothetical protein, conserved [Eimeria tenella]|eukprot:XP_013231039.1 hypothetical protein, conserved [Eimeria tenella]
MATILGGPIGAAGRLASAKQHAIFSVFASTVCLPARQGPLRTHSLSEKPQDHWLRFSSLPHELQGALLFEAGSFRALLLRCLSGSSTARCGPAPQDAAATQRGAQDVTEPAAEAAKEASASSAGDLGASGEADDTGTAADIHYQAAADALLSGLAEQLQERQDAEGIDDVDCRDGVLKVVCESGLTLVLNKHYVTRQIWYASPRSGAQYFDFVTGWRCARTGLSLLEVLTRDISAANGSSSNRNCDHTGNSLSWPEGSLRAK